MPLPAAQPVSDFAPLTNEGRKRTFIGVDYQDCVQRCDELRIYAFHDDAYNDGDKAQEFSRYKPICSQVSSFPCGVPAVLRSQSRADEKIHLLKPNGKARTTGLPILFFLSGSVPRKWSRWLVQ